MLAQVLELLQLTLAACVESRSWLQPGPAQGGMNIWEVKPGSVRALSLSLPLFPSATF